MANKAWFQSGIAIIITLLIIMLVIQVQVIFEPLFTIIATIFVPVLLGGLLYYITQPIQSFLEKRKANRLVGILSIFIIILIVINILVMVIVPVISDQVQNLIQRMPALQRDFQGALDFLLTQREQLPFDVDIEGFTQNILDQSGEIVSNIMSNAITILTSTVSVLITLVLVPFFYFFMLKDHEKFIPAMVSPFSGTVKQFMTELLYDIDRTLRSFIQGQVLVSFILGVLLYISYTAIGLEYALLLGMLALFLNVIPFIGPWMAFIPAGLLAVIQSPLMFVWVAVITLVAQQIESNLITPNVMGQSLKLHPLTVIVVVLAAGNIAGFIGMLVAIPTYAVIKTTIQNIWRYRKSMKSSLLADVQPYIRKND